MKSSFSIPYTIRGIQITKIFNNFKREVEKHFILNCRIYTHICILFIVQFYFIFQAVIVNYIKKFKNNEIKVGGSKMIYVNYLIIHK